MGNAYEIYALRYATMSPRTPHLNYLIPDPHETTAQDLAALKMLLARLNRTSDRLSDADRALLDESVELAERSMSGVRTLSYLLHPPFLDEAGLLSAVRW